MSATSSEMQNTDATSEVEVPTPEIDLRIYVMPAFATLIVGNLEAARRWYVEGLGFAVLAEVPGPTGGVALIHLRRWRYQDLLLVPGRSPHAVDSGGMRLTFAAHGADLDALVAQARAVGGGIVEDPAPTPWNTRDLLARDPDGHVVVFTSELPPDQRDPEFASRMELVKQREISEHA